MNRYLRNSILFSFIIVAGIEAAKRGSIDNILKAGQIGVNFKNSTSLILDDIPCSQANYTVDVILICHTKTGSFFLAPSSITRYKKNDTFTNTYNYNLRELEKASDCVLTVKTTTYNTLTVNSAFATPNISTKEYKFKVEKAGFFEKLNPFS